MLDWLSILLLLSVFSVIYWLELLLELKLEEELIALDFLFPLFKY